MKFCEIELSLFSCTFKPVTLLPSIALIHVSSQRSSASASHQPLRPSQLPPPCSPQQPASPQRSTSRPCAARSAAASGIRCAGNRPYTLNQEPSSPKFNPASFAHIRRCRSRWRLQSGFSSRIQMPPVGAPLSCSRSRLGPSLPRCTHFAPTELLLLHSARCSSASAFRAASSPFIAAIVPQAPVTTRRALHDAPLHCRAGAAHCWH